MPLSDDSTARGWQSQVAIGLASIVAGLVALLLTVGLAAVQLRASLSWKTLQGVVDLWARLGLLLIVGAGVALPLWVAMVPSALWTRWAFAGFGWALLLAVAMVWVGMKRTAPGWLVDRAIRAGIRAVVRRPHRALPDRTDVLVELAGHSTLGSAERRRALVAVALTLTMQGRFIEHWSRTTTALNRLVSGALDGGLAASSMQDVITVLVVLGKSLRGRASVHASICSALADIAQQARARGQRGVGTEALDGLAAVTIERLAYLLPQQFIPELAEDQSGSDTARPTASKFSARRSTGRSRTAALARVRSAAEQSQLSRLNIEQLLVSVLGPEPEGQDSRRDNAYELLEETTDRLVSLLASPRPGADDWPGGWQGPNALADDIRRIGGLVQALYAEHRYSETDTVERALENIGLTLLASAVPVAAVPPDSSGWRDAHGVAVDDPLAVLGETLCELTVAAFEAGFDRRSLLTGRRLLALLTVAAESANARTMLILRRHLWDAVSQVTRQRGTTRALVVREGAFCLGLIAELEPLLAISAKDSTSGEMADDIVKILVYRTARSPMPAAVAVWQTRLVGAGWVDPMLGRVRPIGGSAQVPLPTECVRYAEESIDADRPFHLRDPRYAAALISSLWADAAARIRTDSTFSVDRRRNLLLRWHEELSGDAAHEEGLSDRRVAEPGSWQASLERLMSNAIRWLDGSHKRGAAFTPHGVSLIDQLAVILAAESFADRTYFGVRRNAALVVVEEYDGSRRLLRDQECRARAQFEWGYSGGGPADLAEALATDALGSHMRCSACLGGALYAARFVQCPECHSTGLSPISLALEEVISDRIEVRSSREKRDSAIEWTYTRRELLEATLNMLTDSDESNR